MRMDFIRSNFFALLLLFLFSLFSSEAQPLNVSWKGFSGKGKLWVRAEYFFPLFVELEQTEGVREVQISFSDTTGDNLILQKKVLLSGASKKRIPLYLKAQELTSSFILEVRTTGAPLFQETVPIETLTPSSTPYYLCYSKSPKLFQFFNHCTVSPPWFPQKRHPQTIRSLKKQSESPLFCQPAKYFSSSPEGYEMFQGIVLENTQGEILQPFEQKALQEWVLKGGHLLYCLTDQSSAHFLKDWLGWTAGESQVVEGLHENRYFKYFPQKPVLLRQLSGYPKEAVLLRHQDQPLVLSRSHGIGRVTVLTLDITQAPFLEWQGQTPFVQYLYGLHTSPFYPTAEVTKRFLDRSLSQTASSGQGVMVFLYVLAVVVCCGPLLHHLVHRFPRFYLLFLPLILLFFWALVSWTQLRFYRTPSSVIQTNFIFYRPEATLSHEYLSIFSFESQLNPTFEWKNSSESLPYSYWMKVTFEPNRFIPPPLGLLEQESISEFKALEPRPWGWHYFYRSSLLKEVPLPLTYNIRFEEKRLPDGSPSLKIFGQVLNHSSIAFEELLLCYDGYALTLGKLSPHGVLAFNGLELNSFYTPQSWGKGLVNAGAFAYSHGEIDMLFETFKPIRGRSQLIGFQFLPKTPFERHVSFHVVEGED
jgi:hypothetical protein